MASVKGGKRSSAKEPQPVELATSVLHTVGDTAKAAYRTSVTSVKAETTGIDIELETIESADPSEQIEQTIRPERDELVMENLQLVKYIAHRIANRVPSHVDLDDLINAGIIGLINAADRFEPGRNVQFKTYAEQRVRGAILDSLRDLDWVPRAMRAKKREIEAALHTLEQRLCRVATDEEVAEHLEISLEDFHKSLDDLKGVTLGTFADTEAQDGEGILSIIADPDAEDPHLRLHESEIKDILIKSVDEMPEKERLVVQLYYYSELNMKEIGTQLNITESRVSQLHTKAILRLRTKLRHHNVNGR
ncbi:MAG: FliA/WhiG family RNA polymerase sigma factor [Holophagaceae bacterium]|nr:FliA/WhiG family RNA polymerase sigma factor [Holophagaceae bacterium]